MRRTMGHAHVACPGVVVEHPWYGKALSGTVSRDHHPRVGGECRSPSAAFLKGTGWRGQGKRLGCATRRVEDAQPVGKALRWFDQRTKVLSRRPACLRPWRWASPPSIIGKIPICDGHFRVDSSRREALHSRSVSLYPGALCRIYFLVVTASAFRVYGFLGASIVHDFRVPWAFPFRLHGPAVQPLFLFFLSGMVPSAFADPLDLTIPPPCLIRL